MDDDRQQMPYTPTDAGRVPKIKEFGIEGGWNVIFPVMVAGAAAVMVTFAWIVAPGGHVPIKLVFGMSPLWVCVLWVRIFIAGRPPSYQRDKIATWKAARFDTTEWVRPWLPIPRLGCRIVCFRQPDGSATHPLAAAARELKEEENKQRVS